MAKRLFSDFAAEVVDHVVDAAGDVLLNQATQTVKKAVLGANQSKTTQTSQEKALAAAVAHGEQVDRRRVGAKQYRLHPAKWLKMDKMLKSMFFPMNNIALNFGISSFSGVNNYTSDDALGLGISGNNSVNTARTRGLHRGVAMFTVRNTYDGCNRSDVVYLNNAHASVGGMRILTPDGGTQPQYAYAQSIYRRYHSQPELVAGTRSDAGLVFQSKCQQFTAEDVVDSTKIRDLDLGCSLAQMEEIAASSMVYSDPVFNYRPNKNNVTTTALAGELVRGNTGVLAGENELAHPTIKDGVNNMLTSTELVSGNPAYLGAVKDAVMRIADGELIMDIMNTEQTPCVVEIVIHSKKKNNKTKQQIYNSLYQDVDDRLHRKNPNSTDIPADSPMQGGWQAWYDPSYPLLRIPAGSPTANFISEVHRSQHVLYPGQSKEIKIALGSLWYKIINKNDSKLVNNNPNHVFQKWKDNVGSLYVAVGHSGFEYPQQPFGLPTQDGGVVQAWTTPNAGLGEPQQQQGSPYSGTGFWVGKAHAPSSISLSGKYTEKFYPLTFDRSGHNELVSTATRPSFLTSTAGFGSETPAVPLSVIVSDRVATNQESVIQKLTAGGTDT